MKVQIWQLAIAAFLLVAMGCQHLEEWEQEVEESYPNEKIISFHTSFQSDFSEPNDRASLEEEAETIHYYDFMNESLINRSIYLCEDIGASSRKVEYGMHNFIFIAHSSEQSRFSSSILSFVKLTDTFYGGTALDVNEFTPNKQNIFLRRIVGKVTVMATDVVPQDATSIRMTVSNHCPAMNVANGSGEQTQCADYVSTWKYSPVHIGTSNTTYSVFTFIPDMADYRVGVSLEVMNARGNVISAKKINNVPIKMNQITTLTGSVFASNIGFSFTVDAEWDKGEDIYF